MWIIIGFRNMSICPEPFVVGVFTNYQNAINICNELNEEGRDDSNYVVKAIELDTIYDYEWNILEDS